MKTKLLGRKSILSAILTGVTVALLYSATAEDPKQGTMLRDDIYICHMNKTIKIERRDWPAHQAHGDYKGPCQVEPPIVPPGEGDHPSLPE